jgi:shikimate 5-dehydrogenase
MLFNASSMGGPEETSIPAELLAPDILVLDLYVLPEETRLLREAKEAGAAKMMNGDVSALGVTDGALRRGWPGSGYRGA